VRRGDVYLVDFEPSQGAEASKERPAVIVSNEGTNRRVFGFGWGVVNVVPFTTNIARALPFHVFVSGADVGIAEDSHVQAEQVRAVSIGRLLERIGHVPPPLMRQIDDALRIQLAL
jgi:mRNA interferase MazF